MMSGAVRPRTWKNHLTFVLVSLSPVMSQASVSYRKTVIRTSPKSLTQSSINYLMFNIGMETLRSVSRRADHLMCPAEAFEDPCSGPIYGFIVHFHTIY